MGNEGSTEVRSAKGVIWRDLGNEGPDFAKRESFGVRELAPAFYSFPCVWANTRNEGIPGRPIGIERYFGPRHVQNEGIPGRPIGIERYFGPRTLGNEGPDFAKRG